MKKISKNILVWEIASAIFVILVGSLMHFVFAWSGSNSIVGAFAAVNESTWEHTKLAFFPILVFSLIQYPFVRKEFKNYFTVKAKESYAAVLLIIIIFYTYSGAVGQNYLFMDILTFVIAVIGAKIIAYMFLFNKKKENPIIPIIFIALLGIFFVFATFVPPHIQLFKDTPTGKYGMVVKDKTTKPVACTMEAKLCPIGTYVGRTEPNCEFTPCPTMPEVTPPPKNTLPNSMTEAQARYIAERSCIKGGEALGAGIFNENSKTWWFDANLNSTQRGCKPSCVVSEETKTAEINWRCTGLAIPEGPVCTQEAKLCPDGSYVSRTGPNCEFTPCP